MASIKSRTSLFIQLTLKQVTTLASSVTEPQITLSLAGCSSSILVNVQRLFTSITQLLVVRPVIYTRKLQPQTEPMKTEIKGPENEGAVI